MYLVPQVGSVEEFQGQEKMVIMVSAVRSSNSYVKMDQDFNIGFLTNEKVYLFLPQGWGSFNKGCITFGSLLDQY